MAGAAPWKLRVVGSSVGMIADPSDLRRGLSLFPDPEGACEIMALTSGIHRTVAGDDVDGLVKAANSLPGGIGIYFRINPIPTLLMRPAKDADVIRRRWLYVDVDPIKPADAKDNPATDAEKALTGEVADAVVAHLGALGWPAPVVMDSGNGHGLFWRCDLPCDELVRQAYRRLLIDLAGRFEGKAKIDKAIHNASRLAKLPGTWARKGDDTAERPHRPCRLVSVPTELVPVTWELLSASAPEEKKPAPKIAPAVNGHGKKADAYGKKALEGVLRDVIEAPPGERNSTLYKGAARLGELAAGGVIDGAEAEALLKRAGEAADPDRPDAAATVERGMKKGAQEPRTAPPRKPEPRVVFGKKDFAQAVTTGEKKLTVPLSAIRPMKVDWLVPGRIPKRFITVFAGRTGVGKSFVSCDLIARLTRGGEIPGAGGLCFDPGGALIVSEDSHEYVLAPRLIGLGADLARVHAMTWEAMGNYFLGDTEMLEAACREVEGGVSLVMIDPPTNFLDDVDEHKNSEVRQLVMKVVEWCFSRDLAVLFVLHINKQTGKGIEAINRVMGSVAWVSTSRIAHSFCLDPDDPERGLWMPTKSNLGKLPKGLAYRINGEASVEWLGEVDMTADEALGGEPKARKRGVVASEWLVERFREKLNWYSDDLFAVAKEGGVSRNAIFQAKDMLRLPKPKVEVLEDGTKRWTWWVPSDWPQLSQ